MVGDTQWPSEDEDFDAVTGSNGSKTALVPQRKSVAVISDDESEEKLAAPAIGPPAADEHAADYENSPGNDNNTSNADSEPSTRDDSPPASHRNLEESEVSPEVAAAAAELANQEDASSADIPISSVAAKKSSMGRLFLEVILIIALAGAAYFAFMQYSKNKDLTADNKNLKTQVATLNANPQLAIQKQTDQLISKVGSLMQLPAGETPTVANVSDAAAAKKQSAFFNDAKNGDRVLMYVKAGEAILYRPSTDKIVLVAPLTFSGTPTAAAATPKTTR